MFFGKTDQCVGGGGSGGRQGSTNFFEWETKFQLFDRFVKRRRKYVRLKVPESILGPPVEKEEF